MKRNKKIAVLAIVATLVIGGSALAYAATGAGSRPAEIIASMAGKSVEEVQAARAEGKSYDEQAAELGKLEEFKNQRIDQLKERLADAVEDKRIDQAKADQLLKEMQDRVADCDGDGTGAMNRGFGRENNLGPRDGSGAGMSGRGLRDGSGSGGGRGRGNGMGMRGRNQQQTPPATTPKA